MGKRFLETPVDFSRRILSIVLPGGCLGPVVVLAVVVDVAATPVLVDVHSIGKKQWPVINPGSCRAGDTLTKSADQCPIQFNPKNRMTGGKIGNALAISRK